MIKCVRLLIIGAFIALMYMYSTGSFAAPHHQGMEHESHNGSSAMHKEHSCQSVDATIRGLKEQYTDLTFHDLTTVPTFVELWNKESTTPIPDGSDSILYIERENSPYTALMTGKKGCVTGFGYLIGTMFEEFMARNGLGY